MDISSALAFIGLFSIGFVSGLVLVETHEKAQYHGEKAEHDNSCYVEEVVIGDLWLVKVYACGYAVAFRAG